MKVLLLVLVAGLMPVFAFAYDGARRGPNGGWIIPQTKCHRDSITGDVDCQSD